MNSKTGKFRACRGNHPAALIIQAVLRLRKSWLLNFWFLLFQDKRTREKMKPGLFAKLIPLQKARLGLNTSLLRQYSLQNTKTV